jgi:hypothetical protein
VNTTLEVLVSDRNRSHALARGVLVSLGIAAAAWLAPAAASAATTPESLTNCRGALTPDPSGPASGEPYLLDYKIQCDTDISAYTVIFNREPTDYSTLDDFNGAPGVFAPDGVTPNATASLTCAGSIPSTGINCNAGAGGVVPAWNWAEGSIDPVAPFCKSLPPKAKPGTPAIPRAFAQFVVTDNTGAEDGPFGLSYTRACPKVPNVVPAAKKANKQKSKKRPRKAHRAHRAYHRA